MSCSKHFLMFRWERHAWERRVTHTESGTGHGTDMWSRVVPVPFVTCHAEYVCQDCGAVRDEGECGCDKARADSCAVRLAHLNQTHEPAQRAHA